RVDSHPCLQSPPYLRSRPKEAIGRHQTVNPLMRSLEVVMVDVQADALLRVPQIDEDCALNALTPQTAPEALNLAQSLRSPRRRHYLLDAAFLQLFGESAFASPGHVLAAVVSQDLLRSAVRSQRRPQHFQHQGGRLAGVQAVADDEAAVVVHESHQIHAAVLTLEHKGKQVGLPQLILLCAVQSTPPLRL